jgi:TonB family protein
VKKRSLKTPRSLKGRPKANIGRKFVLCKSVILLAFSVSTICAQELAYSRRMSNVTALFLNSTEKKVDAMGPASEKGTVLVIFRTSERGTVISARAISGSAALQQAALSAMNQWKFQPTSVNGQPIEMCSAVTFDFSHSPATIGIPKPMTASELSPDFQFRCNNGLSHPDSNAVSACQIEVTATEHDSQASPMDRVAAYDEYGLALLKYGHEQTNKALAQLNKAIEAKPKAPSEPDAELAYVHWHRAIAEQQLANKPAAESDFQEAENGFQSAEKVIGNEKIAAYYHLQLVNIAKQHAELLESEKKHSDALAILSRFAK